MISTAFNYAAPDSLAGALDLLSQDGYQLLSADHSGISELKNGAAPAPTLVSLRKVPGLGTVTQQPGQLLIGTAATYAELLRHPALQFYPALAEALATIADPHLRHHSTVGGALQVGGRVHAPVLAALLALEAKVAVASRAGTSEMSLHELVQGGELRPLPAGSLATQVQLAAEQATASRYCPAGPAHGFYANQGVAAAVQSAGGEVAQCRIVLAGFAAQPLRLAQVEAALQAQPLTAETIAAAVARLDHETLPPGFGGTGSDEGYYRHLARVLVRRALTSLPS